MTSHHEAEAVPVRQFERDVLPRPDDRFHGDLEGQDGARLEAGDSYFQLPVVDHRLTIKFPPALRHAAEDTHNNNCRDNPPEHFLAEGKQRRYVSAPVAVGAALALLLNSAQADQPLLSPSNRYR